jgi:ankyrin
MFAVVRVWDDRYHVAMNQARNLWIHVSWLLMATGVGGQTIYDGAGSGQLDVVAKLVERDPDAVNRANIDGRTALHYAAANNRVAVIQFLVDRNANVSATDANKFTPLHVAAKAGHQVVVGMLVAAGSDVNAVSKELQTPLHVAAVAGHVEVVSQLIADKASLDMVDANGYTPLQLAVRADKWPVAQLLVNRQAAYDIFSAAGLDDRARLQQLVRSSRVASNEAHQDESRPLHWAAAKNRVVAAGILLASSADVDARDRDGRTALHVAARDGFGELAALLFRHKANPDAEASDTARPLHLAAANGHAKLVSLLLSKSATTDARNGEGNTSLHIAGSRNQPAIVTAVKWRERRVPRQQAVDASACRRRRRSCRAGEIVAGAASGCERAQ